MRVPGLPPLIGGAIGYFAYDMVRLIEKIPASGRDDLDLDDSVMMFYLGLVAFDHVQHRVWVIRNVFTEGPGNLRAKYNAAVREIRRTRRKLEGPLPRQTRTRRGAPLRVESNFTKAQYMAAVRKAKSYIRAGDIFQVVPSQRFSARTSADPFEIYRALRVVNPSPYLYYLKLDELAVVGSSPEMLVKVQGRNVSYRPIAGTVPRGRNEAEDRVARSETARRSEGARRTHHAGGFRPQRSGPRVRVRLGESRAADVRRALFPRDASGFQPARPIARGRGLFRRADGLLSRGHAFGRAENSRDGNH